MSDDIQTTLAPARIGIVGGGIAGATVALCLGELGLDVTLLEKNPTLVNGPPICHLHAGGNLYREISDAQCLTLLRESIDLVRLYPNAVDYRPTVVAVPTNDDGEPDDLLPRLYKLQAEYQRLIELDAGNRVLGSPEHYFKIFSREDVEALKSVEAVEQPTSLSEWMIPVAHHVDLEQLKFPIIMVQEYGLNLFRLAASAELSLNKINSCSVLTNSKVTNIQSLPDTWKVDYQCEGASHTAEFDFLINAAGFRSGLVDDMLGLERQRLVEFKAAYVTQWQGSNTVWPELIFFGERGTPNGMAQFTPYPDGHFQLHGMTESITLFENGLVESSTISAQPKLNAHFIDKIDKGWPTEEVNQRTQGAIDHLSRFIPEFANSATISSKPLFGAQQIPGDDADLRAAGVSFSGEHYARCEIVKASSAPSVADEIIKQLVNLGYVDRESIGKGHFSMAHLLSESEVNIYAQQISESRHYPSALARCNIRSSNMR
ncbi:oxidoreductase [Psychromonas marina]|uniref:Oxidoreductase n=1 Tax=Psychromonas marina TaxID=88364 RepID=A0ABQ6DZP3_9GAMM|nr:FAD-dependent oxidoreductase [Psychromonas marina]GLS90226.1 oxidoreductase [Psychromonas marina]